MTNDNFSSSRYLAKRLLDCFHIAHPHALGAVDVPFGVFDLIVTLDFVPIIDFNYWRGISIASALLLKMLPKFKMAARGQLQFFLWERKLSQKLFKFYNNIPHNMEMCR